MDDFLILWTKHIFIGNIIASSNTRILEKCTALSCWPFGSEELEFRLLILTKSMTEIMLNVVVLIVAKQVHFCL